MLRSKSPIHNLNGEPGKSAEGPRRKMKLLGGRCRGDESQKGHMTTRIRNDSAAGGGEQKILVWASHAASAEQGIQKKLCLTWPERKRGSPEGEYRHRVRGRAALPLNAKKELGGDSNVGIGVGG